MNSRFSSGYRCYEVYCGGIVGWCSDFIWLRTLAMCVHRVVKEITIVVVAIDTELSDDIRSDTTLCVCCSLVSAMKVITPIYVKVNHIEAVLIAFATSISALGFIVRCCGPFLLRISSVMYVSTAR